MDVLEPPPPPPQAESTMSKRLHSNARKPSTPKDRDTVSPRESDKQDEFDEAVADHLPMETGLWAAPNRLLSGCIRGSRSGAPPNAPTSGGQCSRIAGDCKVEKETRQASQVSYCTNGADFKSCPGPLSPEGAPRVARPLPQKGPRAGPHPDPAAAGALPWRCLRTGAWDRRSAGDSACGSPGTCRG